MFCRKSSCACFRWTPTLRHSCCHCKLKPTYGIIDMILQDLPLIMMIVCKFVGKALRHSSLSAVLSDFLIMIWHSFFTSTNFSSMVISCIVSAEFTISTQLASDWFARNLILFGIKNKHQREQNKSYQENSQTINQ